MSSIIFEYRNAKDEPGRYELERWKESGHYITGFSSHDGAYRTFRKDRVVRYLSQQEALEKPFTRPPPRIEEQKSEILFTGFPREKRSALEQQAEEAGLDVRKTVTQSLMFLVGGPNAGPTKLEKSRSQGVYILGESQFHLMLETGVLEDEQELR